MYGEGTLIIVFFSFHFINSKASNRCNKPPFVVLLELEEEEDEDKDSNEEDEDDNELKLFNNTEVELVAGKGVIDETEVSTVKLLLIGLELEAGE